MYDDGSDQNNDDKQKKSWFGPRRYGFGVRPQTWQGWVIVLAVIAAIVAARVLLR